MGESLISGMERRSFLRAILGAVVVSSGLKALPPSEPYIPRYSPRTLCFTSIGMSANVGDLIRFLVGERLETYRIIGKDGAIYVCEETKYDVGGVSTVWVGYDE